MRFTRVLVLVLWMLAAARPGMADVRHIVILHTNDFHGHLESFTDKDLVPPPGLVGGAAALAGLIRDARAAHPDALLLDAGDIAQGTPVSNLFFGLPVVEFMNLVHYDARTIGNHEFDWGVGRLEDMIHASKAPIICANLVQRANGKMLDGVHPYLIKRVNGVTLGILGLVTPDTPKFSFPDNVHPVIFQSPADTVRKYLPAMRRDGAQMIVLLTHLGVEADVALAHDVPNIDVIVGGHTHTVLMDPKVEGHTVIVQTGCYGRYLGTLELDYDTQAHSVVHFTDKNELTLVQPDKVDPDPAVKALVDHYMTEVAPRMNRVVGTLHDDLSVRAAKGTGDSPLGDAITDAIRDATHADIAIYNAGGIRSPLQAGPVHWGEVYTTLPFDNHVLTLTMQGQAIQDLLQHRLLPGNGLVQRVQAAAGLAQVAGLTYGYDANTLQVERVEVGGIPLDPSKTYTVATIDFLYMGGDGYTELQSGGNVTYGRLIRDVMIDYLASHPDLKAPAGGRIRVLSPASTAP